MKDTQTDLLAAVSSNGRRAGFWLTIIALLSFLPGFFTLPAIDRDEARFAQASRQMVATGDWIDIRLQEAPRYKKPVGIYWLQSVFVAPFGTNGDAPIWVHRLPSLIGATFAVLLTYWLALPLVGARAAFLAGATMAVSLILGVEARLAKTDAVLLATILLAQGVLVRAYLMFKAPETAQTNRFSGRYSWVFPLLFWTALGVGTLVKGPLAILFVGLTVASLVAVERSGAFLRVLRPVPGLFWFLLLVLPWYVAIGLRTNGLFYQLAVGYSLVGKIYQGHEGHGAPPLTHFAVFWATFWPGSLLFALALPQIWRRRREPWLKFLFCWVVPAWIVFEIVVTKLPHYLLPVFPAIAIAAAGILTSRTVIVGNQTGRRIVQAVLLVVGVSAIVAVAAGAWASADQSFSVRLVVFTSLAIVFIGATFRLVMRALEGNNLGRFTVGLATGLVVFYWLIFPTVARINWLWPARQIGEIVATFDGCPAPYLVSAGYSEASLIFSTRTDLVLTNGATAADSLAGRACAIALVEARQLAPFLARIRKTQLVISQIGKVAGYNIGNGRTLDITLFATR